MYLHTNLRFIYVYFHGPLAKPGGSSSILIKVMKNILKLVFALHSFGNRFLERYLQHIHFYLIFIHSIILAGNLYIQFIKKGSFNIKFYF